MRDPFIAAEDLPANRPPKDKFDPATLPVVGFVRRWWMLLLFTAIAGCLALDERVYTTVGWLVYPPVLLLAAGALAAFFRHIFNRQSTDPYTDGRTPGAGNYASDFRGLPVVHKVWITSVQWLIYFIGACIVVSAVMRM